MSLRAFIVEDSPVIRESLIETLQEVAGVEVHGFAECEDGGKTWLTQHSSDWDLAIVDLFLKNGNGLGVVEACGKRRPGQKVVVLTNYATNDIRERCARLGADAVFDKSNELDSLFDFCLTIRPGDGSEPVDGGNSKLNQSH
ncbi:MAG: response regulator [Burkholderiales bacterium]|nr:MAG: response regulator [Burkholderiales bacterium]